MMTREAVIKQYFVDIHLDAHYADLFYVRKSIAEAIQKTKGKFKGNLLDVGCGIMPYKELILENKQVTSYIGLDFESALEQEYALGKPDLFWKGDVIPVKSETVDTVIATELFEHCAQPEMVMKEILRVMRPGGILFFTVPFIWNLHVVPYDEYRYTPFSLKRHLSNAGFSNISLAPLGGLDASLALMIGIWYRNRPLQDRTRKMLWWLIRPVTKWLVAADAKSINNLNFGDGSMVTGLSGIAYK